MPRECTINVVISANQSLIASCMCDMAWLSSVVNTHLSCSCRHGRDTSHNHSGVGVSQAQDAAQDQRQIEAALQNDRAHREEMETGLSMLMQQLRHNAMAIHQTLADEQKSGVWSLSEKQAAVSWSLLALPSGSTMMK